MGVCVKTADGWQVLGVGEGSVAKKKAKEAARETVKDKRKKR